MSSAATSSAPVAGGDGPRAYPTPCEALPGQTGLVAAVTLPPGAPILSIEEPGLVIVDSPHLDDTCDACVAWSPSGASATARGDWSRPGSGAPSPSPSLKSCVGCQVVRYCGKACQAQAWKAHHKYECKLFARLRPRILPTPVRAVVRLLLLRDKGTLRERDWSALLKLQSHRTDFQRSGTERWETISLMSKGAAAYAGTNLGEDLARELYCRVLINSLTLVTATFDPIGICLDPLAASVNHSCDPNAVVTFDGRRLSLRTLREVDKDAEIRISYVDNTNPYQRRQRELAERYFFSCSCPKCQQGPGLREDRFLGDGDRLDVGRLSTLEDAAYAALDKAEKEGDMTSAIRQLSEATDALRRSAAWPVDRQPWPALRRLLAVSYLSVGRWTDAFAHLLTLYFYVDPLQTPEPWHPLRVVHNWVLLTLVLQLADLSTSDPAAVQALARYHLDYGRVAWGLALEVAANVGKSHGSTSTFAIAVTTKLEELRIDMTRSDDAAAALLQLRPDKKDGLQHEWSKLRAIADNYSTAAA